MITTAPFDPTRPPVFLSARAKVVFHELVAALTIAGEDLNLAYTVLTATASAIARAEQLDRLFHQGRLDAQDLADTLATARRGLAALDFDYPLPAVPRTNATRTRN